MQQQQRRECDQNGAEAHGAKDHITCLSGAGGMQASLQAAA
jgi:hypothetical protein